MIQVDNDPVYLALSERFKSTPAAHQYNDPYHRYIRILKYLKKNNLIKNGDECLDLGCLRPELLSLLINNFDAKVTGIDSWDLKEAWPDVKMDYYNTDLAQDFTEVLGKKKFDIVFTLEVIEHIIDTDQYIERLKACTKPGGLIVISTPNISSLRNRLLVPFGAYPIPMEYKNIIHHVRLYNTPLLQSHLKEHGLQPIHTMGVNFLPYRGPMANPIYRGISEKLADWVPNLCTCMIVISRMPG